MAIKLQTDPPERLRPLDFMSGDVPQNSSSYRDPGMKTEMPKPTKKQAAIDKALRAKIVGMTAAQRTARPAHEEKSRND